MSGSVPGRQTVPRSEITHILHMLNFTSGACTYIVDNLRVAEQFNKGQAFVPGSNGLLWHSVNTARQQRLQRGHGFFEIIWMPSHRSFEYCCKNGYSPDHWFANQLADKLASQAALRYAMHSCEHHGIVRQQNLVYDILRRLVGIAIAIAPQASDRSQHAVSDSYNEPRITKLDRISELAKQAGHALDKNLKCSLCLMQVNRQNSMAQLDAILHMKCTYKAITKPGLTLHPRAPADDGNYMFHNVCVNSSHTMATHDFLQVHFCTVCGAWGTARGGISKLLQAKCRKPSTAGRVALADIFKDRRPDLRNELKIERYRRGIKLRPYHCRRASRTKMDEGPPWVPLPPLAPLAVLDPPSLAPSVEAINRKRLAEKQGRRPPSSTLVRCQEHRNRGFVIADFCNKCDQEAASVSQFAPSESPQADGLVSPENQFWGDPVVESIRSNTNGNIASSSQTDHHLPSDNSMIDHSFSRCVKRSASDTAVDFSVPLVGGAANCNSSFFQTGLAKKPRLQVASKDSGRDLSSIESLEPRFPVIPVVPVECVVHSNSIASITNQRGDQNSKGPPCKGRCPKDGWTIDQFCAYCHDA